MPSVEYKFNSFREKKVRDKYLLTTYNGDWIALDKNEYIKLKTKNRIIKFTSIISITSIWISNNISRSI